jgi:hypothetical protein
MVEIDDDFTTLVQVLWLLAQPLVYLNSLVGQETGASCYFLPCSDTSTRFDIGITERHGFATLPSRSMH